MAEKICEVTNAERSGSSYKLQILSEVEVRALQQNAFHYKSWFDTSFCAAGIIVASQSLIGIPLFGFS